MYIVYNLYYTLYNNKTSLMCQQKHSRMTVTLTDLSFSPCQYTYLVNIIYEQTDTNLYFNYVTKSDKIFKMTQVIKFIYVCLE